MDPLLDDFVSHLYDERRLSAQTVRAYRSDLLELFAFAQKQKRPRPQQWTTDFLRTFLVQLRTPTKAHLHPKSLARKQSSLKSFFRWLEANGAVDHNPAELLRSPRLPKVLPRALDAEASLALVQHPAKDSPKSRRDNAALLLLYGLGLRSWRSRTFNTLTSISRPNRRVSTARAQGAAGADPAGLHCPIAFLSTGTSAPYRKLFSGRARRTKTVGAHRFAPHRQRSAEYSGDTSRRTNCVTPLRPNCYRAAPTYGKSKRS
ncbi:MAG: site-specific integrase [Myxococcota bacterium]